MASLTVETALGSFDFLNTSEWEDEEEEKRGERWERDREKEKKERHRDPSSDGTRVFYST